MNSFEVKTGGLRLLPDRFPEIEQVLQLRKHLPPGVECESLGEVESRGRKFPLLAFRMGSKDPKAPSFGLFGGVHGLERIGSQTIIAFLKGYFERLQWDQDLARRQSQFRFVCLPVVNPAGMFFGRRSNMNGVDLMRNAPIDAKDKAAFLVGGHRIGNFMPWYRGKEGAGLEPEAQAVAELVRSELFSSENSLALDVHSGFGFFDRIWYPFAGSREDCFHAPQIEKVKNILDQSYPHHIYRMESQHQHYIAHGDLWDYLYLEQRNQKPQNHFIPWTLEMGSWKWVKKNPLQLFLYRTGLYHPIKAHRLKRIYRRHILLLDFFMSLSRNPEAYFK